MSTLSLRKVKHDSASVDNITLNTDGGVGIGGIDPSTLPTFIDHAVRVQNGGGLGIQSANATDNRWIFFGHGTANLDVQRAGIVNQGSNQSLALATAGAQRLIVDASGRVTMPNQPRFSAGIFGNVTVANNGIILFGTNYLFNPTSSYNSSNGRFTAPVTGFYQFNSVIRYDGGPNTGTYARIRGHVNGSHIEGKAGDAIYGSFASGQTYTHCQISFALELTANDYIDMRFDNANGASITLFAGGFSGYLVG